MMAGSVESIVAVTPTERIKTALYVQSSTSIIHVLTTLLTELTTPRGFDDFAPRLMGSSS
jgi:hypothetical protein